MLCGDFPKAEVNNELQQGKRKTGDSVKLLTLLYQLQNYVLQKRSVEENMRYTGKQCFFNQT
jgi:uncharacterized protein YeeX (DUF496 family)